MEIDQHLVWLLGAINACVSDGNVEEKKLNKNVSDCLGRVKNAYANDNKEQDLEKFKMKATLVFLLCSSSVREVPEIEKSKDFQSVLLTFPELKDSVFFSVVRNQKFYKFLEPLLCSLPPSSLCKLIQEYFTCTKEVTPLTLAISLELLKAMLSSLYNSSGGNDYESEKSLVFSSILSFLSSKEVIEGGTSVQNKSSAYYYMYLCECTYLVMSSIVGKCDEQQRVPIVPEVWAKLWNPQENSGSLVFGKVPVSLDDFKSFCEICNRNMKAIDVNMWMGWNEVMLPLSVTVHRKSIASKIRSEPSSIQSVICNIAFDMLRIVESHTNLKELLYSYSALTGFFQNIAADPDYDPDYDLPSEKLVFEIDLKDERHEKLLRILMRKDDIFTSEKCMDCVTTHMKSVDIPTKLQVLMRLIKHIKDEKEYDKKSVEVVLGIVEDVPSSQLLPIIEEQLSSGQKEILKTPNFHIQTTSVFNQLADGGSNKNSTKHVWLCLQSGYSVVSEAVRLPIAFPGLVKVMVQALSAIPQVCQSIGKSGTSVLINILQERLVAGLQGREEKDFGELVKGLMSAGVLNPEEVMQVLVQPCLVLSEDIMKLELPLELLKSIIQFDAKTVVKPGIGIVSLMLVLAHFVDATAYLDSQTSQSYLRLRTDALIIIRSISEVMRNDVEKYERDISMIKQSIVKYKFHPRGILPFIELLDCEDQANSHADCVLLMISKLQFHHWEEKPLKINNIVIPEILKQASTEEVIMSLMQLLPHCSEEEWIMAFYVTHNYLKPGRRALPTMLVFQKVLYLLGLQVKTIEEAKGHLTSDELACNPISLEHCLMCFSNAAMVYLWELMEPVTYEKKFKALCGIFKWWCQICHSFSYELEVSSLFLMQIVTAIEDMHNSNQLQLDDEKAKPQKNCAISGEASLTHDINGSFNDNEKPRSNTVLNGIGPLVGEATLLMNQLGVTKGKESPLNQGHSVHNHSEKDKAEISTAGKHLIDKITIEDFKKQIEDISTVFLKFVPASNLSSSVASKLKKLHEL